MICTWRFFPLLTLTKDVVAMKTFFSLLGLVMIVEGLPYFAFPDRMKNWMRKIQETPDSSLRPIGFVVMCAGLAITYLFRE